MVASFLASNQPAFRGGAGTSYDAASVAYFAAMSVQPDATRKGLINDLVVGFKADGTYALLDVLCLIAAHDAQAGLINVINPALLLVKTGTMTFTADRGYLGDGSTGFLSTVNNDNGWTKFTLNSASAGVWVNNLNAGSTSMIGQNTGTVVRLSPFNALTMAARLNSSTAVNGSVTDGLGLSSVSRTDASTVTSYRGATVVTTNGANAATALAGDPILLNKQGANFHPGRAAAYFHGGGMTQAQITSVNTRLTTYLTAIGGN